MRLMPPGQQTEASAASLRPERGNRALYHQHFNLRQEPARYLKLNGHIPAFRESHQIDYSAEEPWVRRRFQEQLAMRGMTRSGTRR